MAARLGGVAVSLVLCLLGAACGGSDSPTTPTPVVPACQANNTATVSFGNRSASGTTYTIAWDGLTVATLGPGQTSQPQTVAAGVAHTLEFKIANTGWYACSPSRPVLAQCETATLSCGA